MLRLVRLAILVVLFFVTMSFVIALGAPETGAVEDVVLLAGVVGLLAVAAPVRRIGAASSQRRSGQHGTGFSL